MKASFIAIAIFASATCALPLQTRETIEQASQNLEALEKQAGVLPPIGRSVSTQGQGSFASSTVNGKTEVSQNGAAAQQESTQQANNQLAALEKQAGVLPTRRSVSTQGQGTSASSTVNGKTEVSQNGGAPQVIGGTPAAPLGTAAAASELQKDNNNLAALEKQAGVLPARRSPEIIGGAPAAPLGTAAAAAELQKDNDNLAALEKQAGVLPARSAPEVIGGAPAAPLGTAAAVAELQKDNQNLAALEKQAGVI